MHIICTSYNLSIYNLHISNVVEKMVQKLGIFNEKQVFDVNIGYTIRESLVF